MPLILGYDASGLDGKIRAVIDSIVASLQTWVGGQEGINAAQRLDELSSGLGRLSSVPTGFIAPWPAATAPSGYLLCDGSPVSRTTYPNLYNLIGTTYGAGDSVTTFNVPDLRGRFPLGKATSGTGSTLAGTGGSIDHTHTLSGSTANESAHTHSGTTGVNSANVGITLGTDADVAAKDHTHNFTTGAGSAHSHGAGTLATAAANPPFLALNYVIKT